MSEQVPTNIREIVNVRFENPKFKFDGKRMRVLQERKVVDYSSAILKQMRERTKDYLQTNNKYNLNNQIINLPSPEQCYNDHSYSLTTKFEHLSMNKVKSPVHVVRWTPDGRRCMSGTATGEFSLWNGYGYNFETILQAHESSVRAMAWAHSGSFLASADNLGVIKYWHQSMNNIQIFQGHDEPIRDISFSFNDSKFCTASDDSTIKIWDANDTRCEVTLTGHNWDIRSAQWHKYQSLIASAGKDNLIKFWDPRAAEELYTLHSHKNTLLALKWSLDGNYLLSGGKDQIVRMFDIRSMKERYLYKDHRKEITSLTIHPVIPDLFVSGCGDGSIYFWQMYNDIPLEFIPSGHEFTIWSMEFHPIGHVLATGSMDNTVRFWIRPRAGEEEDLENPEEKDITERVNGSIPGL
ncbi:Flowering time control protein FY [Nosema granulosis]|uniref:Polyadenylation factor subunit 2 n=1 Tax=Nosema granulosis TaxID=83296 RepID=A0A9P6GXL7_9MICR|nr:Flowering time control protein FY [Nosema granulosis]